MSDPTAQLSQSPLPGESGLHFRGDRIVFRLTVDPPAKGRAYVRTDIGHADILRREIIDQVEQGLPRLGREWFDIAMKETDPGRFEAVVGLHEVGHFSAKCLFLPEDRDEPLWPDGPNTAVNVEPAFTCAGNIVYNAFVRQFGPNKQSNKVHGKENATAIGYLDKAGYTVIPPSGTFRDLIEELDFIMGRLGCRYLQLLPIHPTPTTYGRMGRFGSPYAALSFTEVDPALAVFDPKATPLEQFKELVDGVHARSGKLLLDLAINHTGWAARLHATHPQWLARKENGEIRNPSAWGVVWEDLTHLDYRHKALWQYMADVLLTWCRRGVDGFRCDAGYMIPAPAWQYMIAKVRDQFPDTIFFLEGLGGKISVTRDLLNRANFNWAYSELFQNYDRSQVEHYLPEAIDISSTEGIAVHFAETHDNNRLAATSEPYARMRTALCALLSPFGAFAFANGVEWLATEKISVHDASSLNWGAEPNQAAAIGRMAHIMKHHPAFGPCVELSIISRGKGNFIALLRRHTITDRRLVIVANLDWEHPVTGGWDRTQASWTQEAPVDLLTGKTVELQTGSDRQQLSMFPGQVLCLADAEDLDALDDSAAAAAPPVVLQQQLRAKVLEVAAHFGGEAAADFHAAAAALQHDPEAFCRKLNPHGDASRVVPWVYPADLRRQVMVPPNQFVLVRADHPFRVRILDAEKVWAVEESLADRARSHFTLIPPLPAGDRHRFTDIDISIYHPEGTRHEKGRLLLLNDGKTASARLGFSRKACSGTPLLALGTNGRGAMMRAHVDWARLDSRYDALLAANLSDTYPEDRHIMLTRCRAWMVFQGHYQEIRLECLHRFAFDHRRGGTWDFQLPTGQGEHVHLRFAIQMPASPANTVGILIRRVIGRPHRSELVDERPVQVILRPDIEDRNFHQTTKAYTGPEHRWPAATTHRERGFSFAPSPQRRLEVEIDEGRFVPEPEWTYMVHRPQEALRGLDPDSDLFSPGYFSAHLSGGEQVLVTARIATGPAAAKPPENPAFDFETPEGFSKKRTAYGFETVLKAALDQFVVRRGALRSVIAGFPWFLDWGRDTLITARGLAAAGRWNAVKAILRQFAGFESHGTLPNMIHGDNAGNRDTSDAPLWLFTVCADLAAACGRDDFLESDCNGRPLRRVLTDLAGSIIAGTPNGVGMDDTSGLIYSPAHFTWMDTNHPAGTPRQGFAIEIQALWFAALRFLSRIDDAQRTRWARLSEKVRAGILDLFWDDTLGHLVDCRHGAPGQSAADAVPDDALRPNQLLAVTLGAVTDTTVRRRVVGACRSLLVPGAIRSLADRPVKIPMKIVHDGRPLNDPYHPYWGAYSGDEDTRRKPAYHNGTAWTWLFPSFCEAWVAAYGSQELPAARAWLSSAAELIDRHCIGQMPEIVDGDAPHHQRGCDAQAWGVSELLRVWLKLKRIESG